MMSCFFFFLAKNERLFVSLQLSNLIYLMKDTTLPENVELLRTRVVIEKDRVFSVSQRIRGLC